MRFYIIINFLLLTVIYLATCFVNWQFPVNYGDWEADARCLYLLATLFIFYICNAFAYIFENNS